MSVGAEAVQVRFRGRLTDDPESEPENVESRLASAYRARGESFVDGLAGEFAIDLRDAARELRLVAGDPYGNRRAQVRVDGAEVLVDAEIGELAGGVVRRETLDDGRLAEYFGYGELSGSRTFFPGVSELLPGEVLIVERGRERRRRLNGPDLARRISDRTWEESVERFGALLGQAVRRALGGAERVAVWVGGGLDSSPIAALAKSSGREIVGLCWGVPDPPGDESGYALALGRHAGLRIETVPCGDALPLSGLASWPVHPATPEQTPYRAFHERCYERAAELGLGVVLTGFCGDALYLDGTRWFWTLLAARGPGAAIDRLREVARERGWKRAIRTHLLGPLRPRRRRLRRYPPPYLTAAARERLLSVPHWPPDVARAARPRQAERVLALLDSHGAEIERWYAARHGLEIRWPLRDPDLIDFVLAVPDHLLLQGVETRPVLRAASAGLVPEEIRGRRDKASFHSIVERGLEPERLRWAGPLLFDDAALWRGFVVESEVRRWHRGELASDWDRLGYLQCLFAELWRFCRAGGELATLART